jgi:putative restriction endonuclease
MRYLVLTTRPEDNLYGDTSDTYSFPKQYLKHFEPLERGETIVALLYEPRRGKGRESYVAWATLHAAPEPDPTNLEWWRVHYDGKVQPFPHLVPRIDEGYAFEALLRDTPRISHGAVLQGRSVREIAVSDLVSIFRHAGLGAFTWEDTILTDEAITERQRRVVHTLVRERRFQRHVLEAYDFRCSISGLGYFEGVHFARGGLVEAAHIRPVGGSYGGEDHISNGLALTPSLHGLFDAGLFTLEYRDSGVVVKTSALLRHVDLRPSSCIAHLPLTDGMQVSLPRQAMQWPSREHLLYHAQRIFRPS